MEDNKVDQRDQAGYSGWENMINTLLLLFDRNGSYSPVAKPRHPSIVTASFFGARLHCARQLLFVVARCNCARQRTARQTRGEPRWINPCCIVRIIVAVKRRREWNGEHACARAHLQKNGHASTAGATSTATATTVAIATTAVAAAARRPISKEKQQWAGGRELWPGDPECVGCSEGLDARGRAAERRTAVAFLLSMQDGIDTCLSYQPNQPSPTGVHRSPSCCSPFRSSRRQAGRQGRQGGRPAGRSTSSRQPADRPRGLGLEEVEKIKA